MDAVYEAVTQIMERHCSAEVVEAAEGGWEGALWTLLSDGGFTGIGIPEDLNGSGGDLLDLVSVIRAAARFAAPVPVVEHSLAASWAITASGGPFEEGPISVAVEGISASAAGGADNNRGGVITRVPWARACRLIVVPIMEDEATCHLALLDLERCELKNATNLAGEPRDTVCLGPGAISKEWSLPQPSALKELRMRMSVGRTAQMAAAINEVLAMTVAYCQDRHQFGRPIGRFQAVQQQVAVLAGEAAAASSAAEAAANVLDRGSREGGLQDLDLLSIEAARVRTSEAASKACRISHQVHGAIGFTREFRLQQLTRRLWSWRDEPTNIRDTTNWLGKRLTAIGPENLWAALSARE